MEQYNTQMHWAHRERKDTRRSPSEVLGFLTGVRHRSEDLQRAFFSTRFVRVLDRSGYAHLKHWKVYAEESLARREVTLWLGPDVLNVEFPDLAGQIAFHVPDEHDKRHGQAIAAASLPALAH